VKRQPFVFIAIFCAFQFSCKAAPVSKIQETPDAAEQDESGGAAEREERGGLEYPDMLFPGADAGEPGDGGRAETPEGAVSGESADTEGTKKEAAAAGKPAAGSVQETEWYISNGAGMLLEKTYKTRALREKYAVASREVKKGSIPQELRQYYSEPWKILCRMLYEDRKRIRTQWVFQDAGAALFTAAVSNDGSGFMEWYEESGLITEEQRLAADGSGYFVSYTYKNNLLMRAEARVVAPLVKAGAEGAGEAAPGSGQSGSTEGEVSLPPAGDTSAAPPFPAATPAGIPGISEGQEPEWPEELPESFVAVAGREGGLIWKDDYRYARNSTLRMIIRTYYTGDIADKPVPLRFPRFVEGSQEDKEFVTPGNSFSSDFLNEVLKAAPGEVRYNLDRKHRVLSETRLDKEGNVTGELTNVWSKDKLEKVRWESKDEQRVVEYIYDKGNRVGERDYRNGVLERTVTIRGNREVEELYYDGEPVLRAVWENGKKIKEERLLNAKLRD